jgi:hypothetical protein
MQIMTTQKNTYLPAKTSIIRRFYQGLQLNFAKIHN